MSVPAATDNAAPEAGPRDESRRAGREFLVESGADNDLLDELFA